MPNSRFRSLHSWRVSPSEARELQLELRRRLHLQDAFGEVNLVAGIDVGFENNNKTARAAVVVLEFPKLTLVESAVARRAVRFPYIPGYLSFREMPSILAALRKVQHIPDLILCDGQGFAHPRRFGLACHLGVTTNIATIGVAKTRLIGVHDSLGTDRGAWEYLWDKNEIIGVAVRTRSNTKPLYVSAGHNISMASSLHYVNQCCTRYKLPETTRAAHKLASGP